MFKASATPDALARDRERDNARARALARRKAARLTRIFSTSGAPIAADDARHLVRVWDILGARFGRTGAGVPFRLPHVRTGKARHAYASFWAGVDAENMTRTAIRCASSVREGGRGAGRVWFQYLAARGKADKRTANKTGDGARVSDTSVLEAIQAARVSLVASAAKLHGARGVWREGRHFVCGAASTHADTVEAVSHCPVAMAEAVAAARHSLRGEVSTGVTARNGTLRHRAALADDGSRAVAWDMERGQFVTFNRCDGGQFVDMAGRLVCEGQGADDSDARAARRAADAVRLAAWLAKCRLFKLSVARGGQLPAATVAHVRRTAARLARVLRAMARGESRDVACAAVGWRARRSFDMAVQSLAPKGLELAFVEFNALRGAMPAASAFAV